MHRFLNPENRIFINTSGWIADSRGNSILSTAVPFTLVLRYGRMSAALKEAEMCNGREGGGKQGENRTRPERMNERKMKVQAERIWARER